MLPGVALVAASCGIIGEKAWRDDAAHEARFVTVAPDARLEVLDWGGTGPPLVLLAGLGNNGHSFDGFAPALADEFRVISITRRSHGASTQALGGFDLATSARDVAAVMDSLGIERAAFAGHSYGGLEMASLAVEYPGRVSRLVFLDSAYDYDPAGPERAALRRLPLPPEAPMLRADSASPAAVMAWLEHSIGARLSEAEVRAAYIWGRDGRMVRSVTPDSVLASYVASLGDPAYARIAGPVLAIYAGHSSAEQLFGGLWSDSDSAGRAQLDAAYPARRQWHESSMRRLRQELPGAELLVLPDASHYVFLSHPGEVLSAVRSFLRSPDTRGAGGAR